LITVFLTQVIRVGFDLEFKVDILTFCKTNSLSYCYITFLDCSVIALDI